MFKSSEYKRIARDKLKGHWGISILVTFLATLLGGVNTGSAGTGSSSYNLTSQGGQQINSIGDVFSALAANLSRILGFNITTAALVTFCISMLVIGLVFFIFGAAVELGHKRYYIELIGENKASGAGILFSRFDIFGKALWLRIYIELKVLLWMLPAMLLGIVLAFAFRATPALLLTPVGVVLGVIATYRYALATYIMAEEPSVSAHDAVERSKALMAGHKGRLFTLGLSFIGWAILAALTLGIGSLWLSPYMNAANAAFYYDRTGRSIPMAGDAGSAQAE